MARETVAVHGLKEFLKACTQAEPNVRKEVRETFREVGDIIRHDATRRFSPINCGDQPAGSAPGSGRRGSPSNSRNGKTTGKHPEYGSLQMRAALLPALQANEDGHEPAARTGDGPGRQTVREAPLMDYIVIEGVPPYDGRYEFDLEGRELTTREWGWIKRHSGYLPLTIEDGFTDPELVTVFAAIALRRAGKVEAREVPAGVRAAVRRPVRVGDHPRNGHRGGG